MEELKNPLYAQDFQIIGRCYLCQDIMPENELKEVELDASRGWRLACQACLEKTHLG